MSNDYIYKVGDIIRDKECGLLGEILHVLPDNSKFQVRWFIDNIARPSEVTLMKKSAPIPSTAKETI